MIARRRFGKVMIMTAAARALGFRPSIATADPALETTRLRISKVPSVCVSPQYVAQELFGGEGFTDVQYIASPGGLPGANALGAGKEDIQMNFAAPLVLALDSGDPIVILAGVHVGCFELFGTEQVRKIKDLILIRK